MISLVSGYVPRPVYLLLNVPRYLYDVLSCYFYREGASKEIEDDYVLLGKITEHFNSTSRPYPIIEITLENGTKVKIAKTWKTDFERLGRPDIFIINEERIEEPATSKEKQEIILKKLLDAAQGQQVLVELWTQIWSYRPKIDLMNQLMERFFAAHNLNPVFGNQSFKRVEISLNTSQSLLTCDVEGVISSATNENLDILDVHVPYRAGASYDLSSNMIEFHIAFDSASRIGSI